MRDDDPRSSPMRGTLPPVSRVLVQTVFVVGGPNQS